MQANDPKTQRKRKDKGDDSLKSTEDEGRGMKGSSKKRNHRIRFINTISVCLLSVAN